LLSDVLGASMQMITINNEAYSNATEATVVGPFFVEGSPRIPLGGDIAADAAGEPCWVEGTVTDTDGKPVPGARIEVWEADEDGFYDVQYPDDRTAARAHLFAGGQGEYRFWALTPTPYPIPHDGPVGRLLEAIQARATRFGQYVGPILQHRPETTWPAAPAAARAPAPAAEAKPAPAAHCQLAIYDQEAPGWTS